MKKVVPCLQERSGSSIEYYISKEKRVVVAKFKSAPGCGFEWETWTSMAREVIARIFYKSEAASNNRVTSIWFGIDPFEFQKEAKRYLESVLLYGRARCTDGDTFDVEIGKEIARNRLLVKYYRFEKYMAEFALTKEVNLANDYWHRMWKHITRCNVKCKKCSKELDARKSLVK